jgi:RNA polymerase sigma factor (sigma-70 family)
MVDQKKFFEIYDAYAYLVSAVVYKYCKDPALQQDLAQEVWMHIMKQLPKFDSTREIKPWLGKVATNKVLDELRRLSRNPEILDPSGEGEPVQGENGELSAPTPEEEVIAAESMSLIDKILGENSKIWKAFVYRYFEGMTWDEVANRCGTATSTVKKRAGIARVLILEDERFKVWLKS